ncbi:hypothetical protein [Clostridium algidicarnis]|uniref:hypothetical protein n=1 Tax=Clostridium algidicarnis TaxID=37659 RepID=UPI00209A781F|nr:hypothetical protein [Clostridium algidicarnis]
MKRFIGKVIDNGRAILQILLLVLCVYFPKLVNLSEIIRTLLGGQSPDFSTAKYYYLMQSGNWTIGILLVIIVLFKYIRKSNEDKILFSGNIYHDYRYLWFWFCSKILGYNSCNLILVPIAMQYKLVIRGTFENYPIPDESFPKKDIDVIVKYDNNDIKNFNEVNLILEDTYPITKDQIPESKKNLRTIVIKHDRRNDVSRIYNIRFVREICKEVRALPEKAIVNIYSTTNPKHNYEIAKQAFSLANRGNLKELYIHQQEKGSTRKFSKRKKIYRFFEE